MEKEFWDVLSTHPFFVIIVIVGGLFALVAILNAAQKFHGILGFKTREEVARHDYQQNEERRDKQVEEMWNEIKEMREEVRKSYEESKTSFRALEEDVRNLKAATVMILGDRITQKSVYYLREGKIPADEMKEYRYLVDCYHELDGNHGVDTVVEKTLQELEIDPQCVEGEL